MLQTQPPKPSPDGRSGKSGQRPQDPRRLGRLSREARDSGTRSSTDSCPSEKKADQSVGGRRVLTTSEVQNSPADSDISVSSSASTRSSGNEARMASHLPELHSWSASSSFLLPDLFPRPARTSSPQTQECVKDTAHQIGLLIQSMANNQTDESMGTPSPTHEFDEINTPETTDSPKRRIKNYSKSVNKEISRRSSLTLFDSNTSNTTLGYSKTGPVSYSPSNSQLEKATRLTTASSPSQITSPVPLSDKARSRTKTHLRNQMRMKLVNRLKN